MKKSKTIAQKIWLSLAILAAGYFISVGLGFLLGGNTEKRLSLVSEDLFAASVESRAAVSAFDDQIRYYQDMVMIGNMGNVEQSAQEKAKEVQAALARIAGLRGIGSADLQQAETLRREMEIFSAEALGIYRKMGAETDFVFEDADKKETDENMEDEIFRIGQQSNALSEKLSALAEHFSANLKNELAEVSNATRDYRWLNLMLFLVIVAFTGLSAGFFISRSITRPLKEVIHSLSDCSADMLFTAVQGRDASNALAERSLQQAASLEEVSVSLEEMSSMTKLNAENAEKTRDIAENALNLIQDTDRFMTDLMNSMKEITAASKETSKIVKTIDEIAFQTNLLSLNAAVEAARAGNTGAGFAVVAGEVRNLALRSAEAARTTSALIEGNVKKIAEGEKIASGTIQVFKSVAQGSEDIRNLIAEMTSASDNQAEGIRQVNNAIAEMDQVTQSNAESAEEAAAFSRHLNERALQMKELVDNLTLMVGGQKGEKESVRKKAGNGSSAQTLPHSLNYLKTKGKIGYAADPALPVFSQTG
ncbi:MAG: methyl-accepting chemotaxis protein [Desulfobacterales bacterium]